MREGDGRRTRTLPYALLLVEPSSIERGPGGPERLVVVGCRCSVGTGCGFSHQDGDAPLRVDLR